MIARSATRGNVKTRRRDYNWFRYYSPDEGMYISQDPIGLAGGMVAYGYVRDVNVGVDVWGLSDCGHNKVKEKIRNILKKYEDRIHKLDPEAKIGFRGSASTGIKGEHKNYAPFDPESFDVDAFIVSDKLYNLKIFEPKEWWRSGAKIPEIKKTHTEINALLSKEFPGYRGGGGFSFRIYKLSKNITGATIL